MVALPLCPYTHSPIRPLRAKLPTPTRHASQRNAAAAMTQVQAAKKLEPDWCA